LKKDKNKTKMVPNIIAIKDSAPIIVLMEERTEGSTENQIINMIKNSIELKNSKNQLMMKSLMRIKKVKEIKKNQKLSRMKMELTSILIKLFKS
jgi:hypothetical protein